MPNDITGRITEPDEETLGGQRELVDRFGRRHTYLRISVTDRCNLRCLYCMPDEEMEWKRREEILSFEEIERVARIAVALGIEKIRITGGEPFARADVERLLNKLKAIAGLKTLAVTTNGLLLERKLQHLLGVVDSFNVSLDTFNRDRFRFLTGRDRLDDVLAGIDALLAAGYRNTRVNCVVMKDFNEDEIADFVRFTADRPIALRFIEFMPFAGNDWTSGRLVTMEEILARVEEEFVVERLPDEPSPISRDYRVTDRRSGTEHAGTIGVIASMSLPFCDSCSRLRLTAEGKVMPCLHSPLEFDLREALRSGASDDAVADIFLTALYAKPKEHPSGEEMVAQAARVMIQIGG